MANTKVSYEMMQDVAKATEMTWGVKCSIQQCQDKMAWDILVSAYNPFDMLIYYQKETVTDFTLKFNKMPEYIFMVIADMVKKLHDSILNAQPMKVGIADETTSTTFQLKYYNAPTAVGNLPKPATTPWSNPAESTPITSLKEMYEQDSPKKAKKVKKPKLTATELVKQKEAQQAKQDLNEQFKVDTLKWVTEEYFKVSPILDYMKDIKNQSIQGGAQIQPNFSYAKASEADIAEQKALQEAQPKGQIISQAHINKIANMPSPFIIAEWGGELKDNENFTTCKIKQAKKQQK